uniref:Uncharacterized protein n=1 Tax=Arundo donax TaxID=35708 RepID=A0A0A8ZGZ3_ARUDO
MTSKAKFASSTLVPACLEPYKICKGFCLA